MPAIELQKYIPEPYDTPQMIGVKWQIDVKYVPFSCLSGEAKEYHIRSGGKKGLCFYQYTMIDECSRERFVFAYDSFGEVETIDFMKRCIVYMGYMPLIVQTDNGAEFTNCNTIQKTVHAFTVFLNKLDIEHKLIRPGTPRHNGKVERSHRTDNNEFYRHNIFDSLTDLRDKLKSWLIRYNTMRPTSVLGYKTPQAKRDQLLVQLHQDGAYGRIRFVKQNIDRAFAA